MALDPFIVNNSFIVTVGQSSARTALNDTTSMQVEIQNQGQQPFAIALGGPTVVAVYPDGTPTRNRYTILPGQSKVISRVPLTQTHIAYIAPNGAPVMHCTTGEGA